MMRCGKVISLTLLVMALVWGPSPAFGATFDSGDGWYKWDVEGTVQMGSSCCYQIRGDAVTRNTCNLDTEHGTIITDSDCGSSGKLTFYVRSEDGEPAVIRAFDSSCRVSTEEDVTDFGTVALARSDSMLLEIVQARDLDMDVREEALFWLVQAGSDATFDYLDRLLSSR